MACSAVILAGGRSRRMGSEGDKALLRLGGRTLLARIVETLFAITDDIQVVGRAALPADCRPVRLTADIIPGSGPLGGLHAGLRSAGHDVVFCTACDYPFLSADLVRLLVHHAPGRAAVVPRVQSVAHVTQAVYVRDLLPRIEAQLEERRYRLHDLLSGLDIRWVEEAELRAVDPDLRSLLNVNTPEDWLRAQEYIGQVDE